MSTLTFNDGHTIPRLGLGTYRTPDSVVTRIVDQALKLGYRHIDTASAYQNEVGVGQGIQRAGLPRQEVFVTTKLWRTDMADPEAALKDSLQRLGLDYVDLYLIHWPMPTWGLYPETWLKLVELRDRGLVRSVGVSNFHTAYLDVLAQVSDVRPVVNQVELHPSFSNAEVAEYCQARQIAIESWAPLGKARDLEQPAIQRIAQRLGATPAQVVIAWHLAKGYICMPKTVSVDRLKENYEAQRVELTDQDVADIDQLDTGQRIGGDPATHGA
ncbi:MAG: aldo/keto reductase [Propionibacteriaceae bacterium]|jgi:2,5-diketo-D-gluconate reductase A|nr:aldo/keto reductase [Propionibacteriaceae bacterium]